MKTQHPANIVLCFSVCLVLLMFSGCSTQKDAIEPPLSVPESFSESGAQLTPDKWWTAFEDDQLNSVIDSALQDNFDLLTAWERLRAANAIVDRESSVLFPDLEATAGAEATRTEDASNDSETFRVASRLGRRFRRYHRSDHRAYSLLNLLLLLRILSCCKPCCARS